MSDTIKWLRENMPKPGEAPYEIRKSKLGKRLWWWNHRGCLTRRSYFTREDAMAAAESHGRMHELGILR